MNVPFDRQLWSAKECAAYLGQSYSRFIQVTQYREGFPQRCPIEGHPRWSAKEVSDYALKRPHRLPTERASAG